MGPGQKGEGRLSVARITLNFRIHKYMETKKRREVQREQGSGWRRRPEDCKIVVAVAQKIVLIFEA